MIRHAHTHGPVAGLVLLLALLLPGGSPGAAAPYRSDDARGARLDARRFDLQAYLDQRFPDCRRYFGRSVWINEVLYHDFDGDGTEEIVTTASNCHTGTAGPNVHSVYRLVSPTEVVALPIDESTTFGDRDLYSDLVGNRNYFMYVDAQGRLVKEHHDEPGRPFELSPLVLYYEWDGARFELIRVDRDVRAGYLETVRQMARSEVAAHIESVHASGEPGRYQFRVGVRSPDTGCEQYANWWEVVSEDGRLLYRRILAHSHVREQPFARRGGPVAVDAETVVWVRAHMHPTGYGGAAFRGSVKDGFQRAWLGSYFASELEDQPPLPSGCAN